jgi:hypothetical protein
VAGVCDEWKSHFAGVGVGSADIEYLSQFIDRDFLLTQRTAVAARSPRRATASPRKRKSAR